MELTDWTSGLDQQTAQNNLAASPEGQMARQQGLANLALTQGQVQGQQYDLQSKKTAMEAQKSMLAARAQLGKQQEAQGDKTRMQSDADFIQQDIEIAKSDLQVAEKFGLADRAKDLRKDIEMSTERFQKIKMAPIEEFQKVEAVWTPMLTRLEKSAGAALESKNPMARASWVKEVQAAKQTLQSAGIPITKEMEGYFSLPPTDDNLKVMRDKLLTGMQQLKDARGNVASDAVSRIDDITGQVIKSKAESARATMSAEDRVVKARASANGEEGSQKIDYEKLYGDGWSDLTKDQQDAIKGDFRTANKRTIVNPAVKPEDKHEVVMSIVKGNQKREEAIVDKKKNNVKTPEMRKADQDAAAGIESPLEKQYGLPAGAWNKYVNEGAKEHATQVDLAKGDDKPRLGGQDYLQSALQIRNGAKEEVVLKDLSKGDAAGIKKIGNLLERDLGPKTEYAVGAYSQRYAQNMTRAGNEVYRNVEEQVNLGTGTVAGVFSDLAAGTGGVSALIRAAGTSVTDSDSQMYHAVSGYMAREIATVANNGAQPSEAAVKKYQELFEAPVNTPNDVAMLKLLTGIDFVRTGLKTGAPANHKDEMDRRESIKQLNKFPNPNDFIKAMKESGKRMSSTKDFKSQLESLFRADVGRPMTFSSEEQVHAANPPSGTKVIIGGKTYTWQQE